MSQLCLGKHWKDRSDAEKKEFIELFGKLLEETYISKIEGYTNEKAEYLKEIITDKKAQINKSGLLHVNNQHFFHFTYKETPTGTKRIVRSMPS